MMYRLWTRTSKESTESLKYSGKESKRSVKPGFHTCHPVNQPDLTTWCKEMQVGCLTDRHSGEVMVTMGNKTKYVDLNAVIENRYL